MTASIAENLMKESKMIWTAIQVGKPQIYKLKCTLPKMGKMWIPLGERYEDMRYSLHKALDARGILLQQDDKNTFFWDSSIKLKENEWISMSSKSFHKREFEKYFEFDEKYTGYVTGKEYGI